MDQTVAVPAKEETLVSTGGVKIFLRSWSPPAPRAVVVICHGFNAHSGQYVWVAEQFVKAGYAVYALDMRGRGKSDGQRYYVDDVNEYAADVAITVETAKMRNPGLPTFLLGHSAGGVVSAVYTLNNQSKLAGFICESFAFQVPAPGFIISALKGVSHLAPHLPVLKLPMEAFSRDPKVVDALKHDPYVANESQPAKTVAALARADEMLHDNFEKITIPVFIIHGTADKATVYHGSEYFHEHAGSKDKTLKLYKDHFHDLLADTGKEGVMADVVAWIDKHITA